MVDNNAKIIVDANLLPEVLLKVIEAKRLLSQRKAKSSSEAARLAGISRSAFYKYKDGVSVYHDTRTSRILTYYLTLMDNPGVLSEVLSALSGYGANVLTINQNIPVDGAAPVTISFMAGTLKVSEAELLENISNLSGVIRCRNLSDNA